MDSRGVRRTRPLVSAGALLTHMSGRAGLDEFVRLKSISIGVE
jgi:hypothetical protein